MRWLDAFPSDRHGQVWLEAYEHAILQQLLHNQWLNLVSHDPSASEFHRYTPDATWELIGQDMFSAA